MFDWRLLLAAVLAIAVPVQATTWSVQAGAATGGDGLSPQRPFASIQQAADVAKAGDTVIIGPGIYIEHVQIRAKGEPDKPITFKADRLEKGRVIVTGADADVRSGKVRWTLEDKALGLYSIPWSQPRPTRILYSGTDLYPYMDLEHLRSFMAMSLPTRRQIGPQHGYAVDAVAKRLYVRLHSSGKYGPADPNQHTISISGPLGTGTAGLTISSPSQYNFGILGVGDAYITIEGITCETPGQTGVYIEANNVTVRDCWFIGCRSGVSGTAPYDYPASLSFDRLANRVTVEHCFFTQFPAYDDGCETVLLAREAGEKDQAFWARKDVNSGLPDASLNYEVGISALMGKDWVVRRNYIWNAFEGLSSRCTTSSDNAHIYENVFDKLLDNAVETEDHSTNIHIYRNVIRDTFGPISWQPLEGEPWPGPVYCYQNIMYNTPEHLAVFGFRKPSVFKVGATGARKQYGKDYTPVVAAPGLLFFNNTIVWERGILFWPALWGNNPDKVKLYNNIIVTDLMFPAGWMKKAPYLTFANNLVVSGAREGLEGQVLSAADSLRLQNIQGWQFKPLKDSPAIGKAMAIPGTEFDLKDIGALQQGDTWYPLTAGPRSSRD